MELDFPAPGDGPPDPKKPGGEWGLLYDVARLYDVAAATNLTIGQQADLHYSAERLKQIEKALRAAAVPPAAAPPNLTKPTPLVRDTGHLLRWATGALMAQLAEGAADPAGLSPDRCRAMLLQLEAEEDADFEAAVPPAAAQPEWPEPRLREGRGSPANDYTDGWNDCLRACKAAAAQPPAEDWIETLQDDYQDCCKAVGALTMNVRHWQRRAEAAERAAAAQPGEREREGLAQTLDQFAEVICPRLADLLVPYGATYSGWADAADQLRRCAAIVRAAALPGAGTTNQCDGCRQGLPVREGIHWRDDSPWIACTAKRYAVPSGAAPQEDDQ